MDGGQPQTITRELLQRAKGWKHTHLQENVYINPYGRRVGSRKPGTRKLRGHATHSCYCLEEKTIQDVCIRFHHLCKPVQKKKPNVYAFASVYKDYMILRGQAQG